MEWFAVRCIFEADQGLYEERVILWRAEDFDQAIALAEAEAAEHGEIVESKYLGLAQAYRLFEDPEEGAEVFSLMRESDLPSDEYLTQFFDTGRERQRHTG